MAKETFRDGVIHPEFTGQTSSSQPLDETGAPFLSISVNLLYVKKKREKKNLLNDDLWWTYATLWFHTAYSFLTHRLLCKRQDNGQSSELLKPCPGGRDVLRPLLAFVIYTSQNVKSSGREKLCAPPHSLQQPRQCCFGEWGCPNSVVSPRSHFRWFSSAWGRLSGASTLTPWETIHPPSWYPL